MQDASTFWEHVQELRGRLVKSLIAIVLGAVLAYSQWEKLWAILAHPITAKKLPVAFIATSPMETVVTSFKLSMLAGLLLAFPWVTWQVWRFVAPGLYAGEKKIFFGTFIGFVVMFGLGAVFCYYFVLPAGLSFLANYMSGSVAQSWKQSDFAAFIIRFLLAFGIIFELPVAAFTLSRLGMITPKGMWSSFRIAIVIIFISAALLTPGPDPVSQLLMAIPLCLLYLVSIGICKLAARPDPEPAV